MKQYEHLFLGLCLQLPIILNFKMMKKNFLSIFILSLLISMRSCQDVVNVDLKTGKERLVIEALIQWEKNTQGNEQTIKLRKTTSFYDNQVVPAIQANISIQNLNTLTDVNFTETEDGIYQTSNFEPIFNDTYQLTVIYNNEIYQATSKLLQAPEVLSVYQSTEEGFSLIDPEANIIFQDFENQTDYYRATFNYYKPTDSTLNNFDLKDTFDFIFSDQFQENNPISFFYENEDIQPNDLVEITLYAISKRYFNYLEKLQEQADAGFGPFSLPPINVKGNIINMSNNENYPYGYFSLNEVDKTSYVFQ
jgi:hypothetical protein